MYALIALNGYEETVTVRVITVGIHPTVLKEWLVRPSMYWWNQEKGESGGNPPKLTWRHPYFNPLLHKWQDYVEEALFCGSILGKPVTKLQIVKIEAYGI